MIFFFTVWKKNPYVYRIFSPQLKYVCMSVSFSNYLATHTQGSCIKFPTSEVRAASPFVSCPTGRQKGHPVQHHQHLHSTCRCSSEGPVHALSHLPCPWRPAEPQPWTIYQQKTAQSSEQRQHWARHKICLSQPIVPMGRAQVAQDPLKVSAGRAVVHPSEQHSTKCCCAQLPGAQTFPEHTERCSVLFGLRLNTSGPQVAGYPKMWLFLHLPYFFSQEST